MLHIKNLAFIMAIFSFGGYTCKSAKPSSVLVCYGKINPDKIRGYKYVILESAHYTALDIKLIKENNELVLGYISIGEVNPGRDYYEEIKDKTLGKNKIWDSYYLNLADETTRDVLLRQIGKIKKKNFDGLFLDTVDVFGKWGPHPEKGEDYIRFLQELNTQFPDMHLMQNSGISMTEKVHPYINSIALESVFTDYNFKTSTYQMRKKAGVQEQINSLKLVSNEYKLPVIVIEYAQGKNMYHKVAAKLQPFEWDFFIGSIDLQEIPPFK